jgi:hypothetical protein
MERTLKEPKSERDTVNLLSIVFETDFSSRNNDKKLLDMSEFLHKENPREMLTDRF